MSGRGARTQAGRVDTRVNAWSIRFHPSVGMSADAARTSACATAT